VVLKYCGIVVLGYCGTVVLWLSVSNCEYLLVPAHRDAETDPF
jgi:hypothetical protein